MGSVMDAPSTRDEIAALNQVRVQDDKRRELAAAALDERRDQLADRWYRGRHERRLHAELREFALGDQIAVTPGMRNETQAHQQSKPRFAPNLLGVALRRLSYLYNVDPLRSSTTDGQAEVWRRILWGWRHTLRGLYQFYDPLVRLHGTCLGVALPAFGDGPEDMRAALRGERERAVAIDVHVFTPDEWVLVEHPDDRRFPGAAAVHWDTVKRPTVDENGRVICTDDVEVHYYWDDRFFEIWHDFSPVFTHEHELGGAPICTYKNTLDPRSPYGRPFGGRDLVRNCRTANHFIEEVLHTGELQRGQPKIKAKRGEAARLVLGPDVAVEVDEPATDFDIVPNAANLPGMIAVYQLAARALALGFGLAATTFDFDGDALTVDNLIADEMALGRDRIEREGVALDWERNTHRIVALQWRAWGNESRELDHRAVRVHHRHAPPPLTREQTLATADFELLHGIRDEYDTCRLLEPHLSDDEVEEMVERGLEARTRRMLEQATVAGHARDVAGGVADPQQLDGQEQAQLAAEDGAPAPSAPLVPVEVAPAPAPAAPPPPAAPAMDVDAIVKLRMNGAQFQAVQALAEAVVTGTMSRDGAVGTILLGIPDWDEARVAKVIDAQVAHAKLRPAPAAPPASPTLPPAAAADGEVDTET